VPAPPRLAARRVAARRVAASGVAAIALAAGLGLAACTGGSAAPAAAPAPSPARHWPVEIDSAAIGLEISRQGLIVVTPGFTKFPPQVYRFGLDGVRQARQGVAGNPNGLGLAPDGGVWIPAITHPDMASGTGIQLLDPDSLRVRREVRLPAPPLAVAFVGGQAWVGTAAGIKVLDARTLRTVRSLPQAGAVYGLRADPAGRVVLAVQAAAVESLDARTGRRLARRPIEASGTITAVPAGGGVWIGWPDNGSYRLRRFDLPTLRPGPAGPTLGVRGAALAGTPTAVWVADHAGRLLCLDPTSGAVRSDRKVPNDAAVAADDRYVFVGGSHLVDRVDATC
jgi:outer membrane protein assembly factor BamB